MKTLHSLFLILTTFTLQAQSFPTETIVDNGPVEKRINILFLGDGFDASEQVFFKTKSQTVANEIFEETPFKEYANFFNTAIIQVPSTESGVDHPATATDVTEPAFPASTKNTYFDGTFDGYKIHRLTIIDNQVAAFSVAAANYPSYDQILMLLNSEEYGGSGGAIATFTIDAASTEVGLHEMGHSFANLRDEYWAGDNYAKEGINMTKETDPNLVKWKSWMNTNGIGIYQHTGGGMASQWYRPHQNCKMKALNNPFCSVCTEGIIDKIYSLVGPVDAFSPIGNQEFTGDPMPFSLDLVLPNPNTLKITWDLDGIVFAQNKDAVSISDFPTGLSTLTATVTDTTTLSHKAIGYTFSTVWTINNKMVSVLEQNTKLFYKVYPNPTSDFLFIEFDGDFPVKETSIQLISSSGQVIFSERKQIQSKAQLQINTKSFPKGSYVLKIMRGSIVQSIPMILK